LAQASDFKLRNAKGETGIRKLLAQIVALLAVCGGHIIKTQSGMISGARLVTCGGELFTKGHAPPPGTCGATGSGGPDIMRVATTGSTA